MSRADRRAAAVLGSPIGHSLSPALHQAAYAALGLDWSYQAIECDAAGLPAMVDRLAATHAGLSLTMPLKEAVLPLLDDCEATARELGAVNTLVYDGPLRRGYNTDVAGVLAALDELGLDLAGRPVVLLGAGGAARAVLAALGSRRAGPVTVVVRSAARARGLLDLAARRGVVAAAAPWRPAALDGAALVVSAVPPSPAVAAVVEGGWPTGAALFDLTYAPWPTDLARVAMAAGAPVVGGLPMLAAQAAEQVRLMTGQAVPLHVLRSAGEAALAARG